MGTWDMGLIKFYSEKGLDLGLALVVTGKVKINEIQKIEPH